MNLGSYHLKNTKKKSDKKIVSYIKISIFVELQSPKLFCDWIAAELLQNFVVSNHHAWASTQQLNLENLKQCLMNTVNL